MVAKSIRNVVYGTWKDGSDVYKDKDGYYVIQWDPKKDALYNRYLAKSWKPIKYAPSRNTSKKTKTAKKSKTKKSFWSLLNGGVNYVFGKRV